MTTAGAAPLATTRVAPSARRPARTLRPDRNNWPIWGFTAGVPLTFLLGLHGFWWCMPGVVLGSRILRRPRTEIPRSTFPLILYLCWVPLGFSMLGIGNLPIFLYRWSLFIGCFTVIVWITNSSEDSLPTERVVDWMAALWVSLVAFGWLAQVLPTFHSKSPFTTMLGPAGGIDYIARISDWKIADFQALGAGKIARPAAPFGAANSWGSAVGILTPFFIRSWMIGTSRRRKRVGAFLLAAAALPIVTSVNRGLWISLALAFVYFTARKALRGRFTASILLALAIVGVAVAFVATPLGTIVQDRLVSAEDSNDSRAHIYEDAWNGALDSPLAGNGAPRPTHYYKGSPPVGTHGLIWYLMFCHGFVGLALFTTWMFTELVRSGSPPTSEAWWSHLTIFICVVQIPFYGLIPHVVLLGMAVGVAHRDLARGRAAQRAAAAGAEQRTSDPPTDPATAAETGPTTVSA